LIAITGYTLIKRLVAHPKKLQKLDFKKNITGY